MTAPMIKAAQDGQGRALDGAPEVEIGDWRLGDWVI